MQMSSNISQLAKALAAAQGELKNPPLDSHNPFFKSRYASLAGVRDSVFPVLARHGLACLQLVGTQERGPILTTLLLHQSGEWLAGDGLALPVAKNDAQGYGSALTYARRYALMAMLGVVGDDDDDGNAAVAIPATAGKTPSPAAPTAAAFPPSLAPAAESTLSRRIRATEAKLMGQDLCQAGELIAHLQAELSARLGPDMQQWPEEASEEIRRAVKDFERFARERRPAVVADLRAIESTLHSYSLSWQDAMRRLKRAPNSKPSILTVGDVQSLRAWIETFPETAA